MSRGAWIAGAVLAWPRVSWAAEAAVFAVGPLLTPELERVELQDLDAGGYLQGRFADVVSCVADPAQVPCVARARHAAPDENGDFIFEPVFTLDGWRDDAFAEAMAYHHVTETGRWIADTWGVVLPTHTIVVNAHLGASSRIDLNSRELTLAAGGGANAAYDATIITHEMGHALQMAVAQPGYHRWKEGALYLAPAALGEARADLLSWLRLGVPTVGDYGALAQTLSSNEQARDLNVPRRCPGDRHRVMHEEGRIYGSLLVALSEVEGVGAEAVRELFWRTLLLAVGEITWTSEEEALRSAADELEAEGLLGAAARRELDAVLDEWDLAACDEPIFRLEDGDKVLRSAPFAIRAEGVPFYDHFALDVPSEVREFGLDTAGVDPSFGVYDLFWRRGEPVDWTTDPPTADGQVEIARSPFSFRADGQTAPLVPGETWYFGLRWRGEPGAGAVELTAVASQEPPEDSALEGCACGAAVAPGGRGSIAAWILALVGLLRRRSGPTSAGGVRRQRDRSEPRNTVAPERRVRARALSPTLNRTGR